jgi:hypothetical protein
MRIINLDVPTGEKLKAPRFTFCMYGPTGSSKTTTAASFPRPVFLSETSESGYESLRGISDEFLFESGVKPIVIGIEKMNDMALAREALTPHILSGMVQTVVIDSLTFYADLYLNYLFAIHAASNGANLKAYGALGQHLRDLRVKWHQMGCNVVSLCLAQDPDEDRPNGLPSIPGKEAGKFGASCDFLFYMRHDRFKQGQTYVENFELHSKPYGKYVARARRAVGMPDLPSPLVNYDYSGLINVLGYDLEATKAALPPYKDPTAQILSFIDGAQKTAAAPVAAAATATAPRAPVKPHVPTAARAAAVRR